MHSVATEVAVIGAGSVGVSVAYYLKQQQPDVPVTLIDSSTPLSLTSAQSGENYRNWWPHPVIKRFMDRSITLLDEIAERSGNRIQLSRRGYLLVSRDPSPQAIFANLAQTFTPDELRWHTDAQSYGRVLPQADHAAADGVDILTSSALIQQFYPYFDPGLNTLIHIRRAGMLSAQQLGAYMLEAFKSSGGQLLQAQVQDINQADTFTLHLAGQQGSSRIQAAKVVNAAGPFVNQIASMLSIRLPVSNVLQQKIAFEDVHGAIARSMPFAIDLDQQMINWSDDEKQALQEEAGLRYLLEPMPGSIHCRPEGGDQSRWIKLGWAFNTTSVEPQHEPQREPLLDAYFPEIVVRGASRLNPALSAYIDGFPRNFHHYGGYYTLTDENWPLIGETEVAGFYVATAMSGFGTMAACATGELLSHILTGNHDHAVIADYARPLSLQRYHNSSLLSEIQSLQSRGIL